MIRTLLATVGAALVLAPAAMADPATIDVGANGNIFTGGLSFTPSRFTARVGDVVRVTNTDFLVPHTFTEKNALWDLTGDYFPTPITPAGFAPGSVQQRSFEAGTASFYCRVHPTQMTGVIAVPVALALKTVKVRSRGHARKVREVVATWSAAAPASGEGFDVEVAHGDGPWVSLASGTTTASVVMKAHKKGTVTHVRARLRSLTGSRATDFSPDAEIVSDQQ
jgi:plastocyanin